MSSVIILVIFTFLGTFLRLFLVRGVARGFSFNYYLQKVLIPSTFVGFIATGLCLGYSKIVHTKTIIELLINTLAMIFMIAVVIWFLGVNKGEKSYILNFSRKIIKR